MDAQSTMARPGTVTRAARLRSIDALRAIAAGMVVLRHSALGEGSTGLSRTILTSIATLGAEGVGLFLVISGFSIHLRWAGKRWEGFSPKAFWKRRIVRLYPTYYLALAAIVVATFLVLGTDGLRADLDAHEAFILDADPIRLALWVTVIVHLSVAAANVWFVAMLPQAWSLALEEQIYALYSALLRFRNRIDPIRLAVWALGTALAFNVAVSLLATPAVASGLIYTQVPARIFEWTLGLLAAEVFVGRIELPRFLRRLPLALGVLVVAAACGLTSVGTLSVGSHRTVLTEIVYHPVAGLGFFMLLSWAVSSEERLLTGITRGPVRLLAWMGLFSYSMYLLHPAIMRLVGEYVPGSGFGRRLVLWSAVVVGSYLFYATVERRFINRNRPARAPAPEPPT